MGGGETGGLYEMTEDEEKIFWSLYRKWEETQGGFSKYYDSFQAIKDLRKAQNERGRMSILKELQNEYGNGETFKYGYTNENGEYVRMDNSDDSILQMMIDYGNLQYQRGVYDEYSDDEFNNIPF